MRWKEMTSMAAVTLLLTGCETETAAIRMSPTDGQLNRVADIYIADNVDGRPVRKPLTEKRIEEIVGNLDDGQYLRMTEIPGAPGSRFERNIRGLARNEGTGALAYYTFEHPLGSLSVYVERVTGPADLAADLEAKMAPMKRLNAALADWLENGDCVAVEDRAELAAYIRGPWDALCRNIVLIGWRYGKNDAMMRIGLYLNESFGMPPAAAASFTRKLLERLEATRQAGPADENQSTADQRSATDLAEFAGVLIHIQEVLEFGARENPACLAHLRARPLPPQTAGLVAAVRGSVGPPPPPDENGNSISLMKQLCGADPLESLALPIFSDETPLPVTATFAVPADIPATAILTNGRLDIKTRKIDFSGKFWSTTSQPPVIYATWAQPNETFQQTHLGKIAVSGQDLTLMILAYSGLSAEEQALVADGLAGSTPENAVAYLESLSAGWPAGLADFVGIRTLVGELKPPERPEKKKAVKVEKPKPAEKPAEKPAPPGVQGLNF